MTGHRRARRMQIGETATIPPSLPKPWEPGTRPDHKREQQRPTDRLDRPRRRLIHNTPPPNGGPIVAPTTRTHAHPNGRCQMITPDDGTPRERKKYPPRPHVDDDDPRFTDPRRCGHYGIRRADHCLCTAWVVSGTQRCPTHSGKRVDLAVAEGIVSTEFNPYRRFDLAAIEVDPDQMVDPGTVLLRLVAQAWWRVNIYAEEIAKTVANAGSLTEALTGNTYAVTDDGQKIKTGEYIRAVTLMEADERDRAVNYASKAVAAGLAERQVAVLEAQVKLFERALVAALADAGIHGPAQEGVLAGVERHLRVIAG